MSTATINTLATEHRVADLGLADWGRKEISIASQRAPQRRLLLTPCERGRSMMPPDDEGLHGSTARDCPR